MQTSSKKSGKSSLNLRWSSICRNWYPLCILVLHFDGLNCVLEDLLPLCVTCFLSEFQTPKEQLKSVLPGTPPCGVAALETYGRRICPIFKVNFFEVNDWYSSIVLRIDNFLSAKNFHSKHLRWKFIVYETRRIKFPQSLQTVILFSNVKRFYDITIGWFPYINDSMDNLFWTGKFVKIIFCVLTSASETSQTKMSKQVLSLELSKETLFWTNL